MSPEFIRLLISAGLIGSGAVGYSLVNRKLLRRANRKQLGLEGLRPNIPAVLYFTTPHCMPCKTTQRPALARLLQISGDGVQVVQVDADEKPELAESWGVLSVPTTFVIDSDGQARRVNHGVASAEKLLAQLEEVEGHPLRSDYAAGPQPNPVKTPGSD